MDDKELEANQQQEVSASVNQVPIQFVKQPYVDSESSSRHPVHQASSIPLFPQTSDSPKPMQIERSSIFTPTERIAIVETNDRDNLLKEQEAVATVPAKVLVWMPPGITTWMSQEITEDDTKLDGISTTPISHASKPVASETFSLQANERSEVLSPLLSSLPLTPIAGTADTRKMLQVEARNQPSKSAPTARALIPTDNPALSKSDLTRGGLEDLNIRNSVVVIPRNQRQRHGISFKKSDPLL